ncbi:MAG: V-type ATP synthase subunit F [Acholeplasma sp.]|uniref:ATP synthase subunit F n=1 Tax=Hujiaoplasma nucleasis TaxID=2725268 RepID=A0A7L6N2R7_9MOLU|nr:V-type ATP synthase subunit F [Hujiaoplasma nucleasis]MDY0278877.1 V-type ATP synthase subunit F [Acholeplasma sp.]QLY40560.1 ATP synthase subunit F [Hujiaoplasma nucleasis]
MKFFLITDNIDSLMGMRLVGIEGVIVHDRKKVIQEIENVLHDESVGILLITTKLVDLCPEVISELKLKRTRPLIVEIPDRHGGKKIGVSIDEYVSDAIGVKL